MFLCAVAYTGYLVTENWNTHNFFLFLGQENINNNNNNNDTKNRDNVLIKRRLKLKQTLY